MTRIQTPTGEIVIRDITRRWKHGDWHWTGTEDAETLARYGFTVLPDLPAPEPPPPREQSPAETQYQAISESLGFATKPGTDDLLAVAATVLSEDIETATLIGWQIMGILTELTIRQGIAWEDWIWVS